MYGHISRSRGLQRPSGKVGEEVEQEVGEEGEQEVVRRRGGKTISKN